MLTVWYLVLFQIYPIVHLHWHEGEGLETCFMAVEYDHADRMAHQELHAGDEPNVQAHAHDNLACPHAHLTAAHHPETCHHFHTQADFDHFFNKNSESAKKFRSDDQVIVDYSGFSDCGNPQILAAQDFSSLIDFHFSSIPNKSPPVS